MKQLRFLPVYFTLIFTPTIDAIPPAQHWQNFLNYFSEHKETVTKNKPYFMGAVGLLGAYGLWRFAKHKHAESIYTTVKISHAKLSDQYIQECALIDETDSLDAIITAVAHERMQPLQIYLEQLSNAVNSTAILHEKLHKIKVYIAQYHSDIQKLLNNLAQLHNNLYRLRKQVFGIIGLQLWQAQSDEYSNELLLLGQTFPELSSTKTLRLLDFANETMRTGLHTLIFQKFNTPEMDYPYLAYFKDLQRNMDQLHESLNDIDQAHPAYIKISQLLAQLRIIGKFVVTDNQYIQEKQSTQEQYCLKEVEGKLETVEKNLDVIQTEVAELKEAQEKLEKKVGQLETDKNVNQESEETDSTTQSNE